MLAGLSLDCLLLSFLLSLLGALSLSLSLFRDFSFSLTLSRADQHYYTFDVSKVQNTSITPHFIAHTHTYTYTHTYAQVEKNGRCASEDWEEAPIQIDTFQRLRDTETFVQMIRGRS